MEYKQICFYNYFGNGDLFNTRGFIGYMMNQFPETEFYYAHPKVERFFEDIPKLKYSKLISEVMPEDRYVLLGQNDDIYINTWLGLNPAFVLPGIGCTVEAYYRMWNYLLRLARINIELPTELSVYYPVIDYKKLKYKRKIDTFLSKNKYEKKILISNGHVQSEQAENFDMSPVIDRLCKSYKDICFIVTEPIKQVNKNLFVTDTIIKSKDGFDLNEISYLSLYCDTIVGRSSGPYVFAQVKENYEDPQKAFLSFTYHINAANFYINVRTPAQKFWSNATGVDDVYNKIAEVIER